MVRETDTRLKKGALAPYYYYLRKGVIERHHYCFLRKGALGPQNNYLRKGVLGPHYYLRKVLLDPNTIIGERAL